MAGATPDRRCTATSRTGEQCGRWAIVGGTVCDLHGGASPSVRRKAALRQAVAEWSLDQTADPVEVLSRALSVTAYRHAQLVALLQQRGGGLDDPEDWERSAATFIGVRADKLGNIEEYVTALADLEAKERERMAKLASMAITAGLAERQVRLAEEQGRIIAAAFRMLAERWGVPEEERARFLAVSADVLREVAALDVVETPADISWGENGGAGGG